MDAMAGDAHQTALVFGCGPQGGADFGAGPPTAGRTAAMPAEPVPPTGGGDRPALQTRPHIMLDRTDALLALGPGFKMSVLLLLAEQDQT